MILPLAAASHRLSLCSEINGASMWDPMEAQSLFIKKKVKIKNVIRILRNLKLF